MAATFGPQPYGPSDFLLGLEQAYCFIPAMVLICTLPFYLPYLRQWPCVKPNGLLWGKLGVVGALASVQLFTVARWWRYGHESNSLDWLGAALSCLGAFSLAVMLYISHAYYVRSIPLLNLWLVATVVADIAIAHTYFNPKIPGSAQGPQNTIAALKVSLLVLEQVSKHALVLRRHLDSPMDQEDETPLETLLKQFFTIAFQVDFTQEERHRLQDGFGQERLNQRFSIYWEQGTHFRRSEP